MASREIVHADHWGVGAVTVSNVRPIFGDTGPLLDSMVDYSGRLSDTVNNNRALSYPTDPNNYVHGDSGQVYDHCR